jgi:hypothetical protein
LPVGAPEGLNTQAHPEQPQPRKCCCSTHTSLRLIATLVAAPRPYLTPTRSTVTQSGRSQRCANNGEVYLRQFLWSVGHPTHAQASSSCRTPDLRVPFVWIVESFGPWSRFGVAWLRVAAVNLMSDALQKPSWGEHCILFRISSNNRALFPDLGGFSSVNLISSRIICGK